MPAAVDAVLNGGNLDKILKECQNFPHTKGVGNYLVGKMINKGSFAKVMEGLHIPTGQKVAIKVIDKKKAKQDSYVSKNMKREPRIHQMIKHPNIVQLYETLETENSYYMVMELCLGGDLMDQISAKMKLEERDVKKYTRQIMSAVVHLHQHGIVHRDLKIENFLLDENNNIKIVDFGLSNTIKSDGLSQELLKTQCGSPAYAAPELLANKKYGPKVDAWSVGVSVFAMLTGTLPFTVEPFNIKHLYQKMINGEISLIPPEISAGAVNFIHTLLEPDPVKRPTVEEAMEDKWLDEDSTKKPLSSISYKHRLRPDEFNSTVLSYMTTIMDVNISEITNILVNNKPSPIMASYYLLLKKMVKNQKEYRLSKKKESKKRNVPFTLPWLEFTDNDAVLRKHLLENEVQEQKRDCDQIESTENQNNVKIGEDILQNESKEVKVKKSPVLCEPIQEDEIALILDNQENVLKASKFANREIVYLEPPDSSQQYKIDSLTIPLSNKDLNQQEDHQENNSRQEDNFARRHFAEKEISIQIDRNQSVKLQTQQTYNQSSSYIGKAKTMPINRHINETPPYQTQGAQCRHLKSEDEAVPPNCFQRQDRESLNVVIVETSHQSTLPKLRQPATRDNVTKKISWVTSSQYAKSGSPPLVINGTRPPVFPMTRQKNIIVKSLGYSKEKSHLPLDSGKAKRNTIQLITAHKTANLNLPLLLPAYQKRSEKKKEIFRSEFVYF